MEKTTTLMKNRYTLAEHYTGMEDTFVPALGVTIIYPAEDGVQKMKLGDGQTTLANLPWVGGVGSGSGEGGTSVLDSLLSLSGTNKKTLNMNNCSVDAAADYAVVGGTNDKTVISNILGSLASTSVDVAKPIVNADCGISFGSGTVVNSTGGNAIGVWNTSGVKGYYWRKIVAGSTAGTYVITLSTKQDADEWVLPNGVTFDWRARTTVFGYVTYEGDTISIVNDSKYPVCAKIIDTGTDSETGTPTITVDSLPFSERASVSLKAPDDYTIYACYEKSEVTGVNSRWYPRSGAIELGWAGTAFGVENLVTGSGGFAGGWNNWQAGEFGATFGRENVTGYAGFTAGQGNKNYGNTSIVVGNNITVKRNCINNAAFGKDHNLQHDAGFAAGSTHIIKDYGGVALGSSHEINAYASAGIGLALTTNKAGQVVVGKYNNANTMNDKGTALFVVGNGTERKKESNAFIVHSNGTAILGNGYSLGVNNNALLGLNTEIGNQQYVFVAGNQNIIASTGNYGVATGYNTRVGGTYGFAANYKTNARYKATSAFGIGTITNNTVGQFVVGRANLNWVTGGDTDVRDALFVVGNGKDDEGTDITFNSEPVIDSINVSNTYRSNAFMVMKDGRARVGKAPTGDMDVVNLAYLKDYLLDKEW